MGDFNIFNSAGQFSGLRSGLTAEKNYLCAGTCSVADENNSLGRHIGEQANSESTFSANIVAEGTG